MLGKKRDLARSKTEPAEVIQKKVMQFIGADNGFSGLTLAKIRSRNQFRRSAPIRRSVHRFHKSSRVRPMPGLSWILQGRRRCISTQRCIWRIVTSTAAGDIPLSRQWNYSLRGWRGSSHRSSQRASWAATAPKRLRKISMWSVKSRVQRRTGAYPRSDLCSSGSRSLTVLNIPH